ncbi:uncharacterized protein uimc1 isoform X2 [Vanacampus margaritifer]
MCFFLLFFEGIVNDATYVDFTSLRRQKQTWRRESEGKRLIVQPSRMPQRKQCNRDGSPESQPLDQDSQDDKAVSNDEQQDECSASLMPPSLSDREKRWRDRKYKVKSKEMTEEEMMALALHLSAQEAQVLSSHQVQQEDAAVMKAITESMFNQRQESSQSQSLLTEACSRPGYSYPNGVAELSINLAASGDVCTNLSQEVKGKEETNQDQKRKKKETPLPELSPSRDVCTQALHSSLESAMEFLDSPQSCDSTQIDDSPLLKSPVFPMSGRRARVLSSQLSQDVLQSCKTYGFMLCSQLMDESVPSSARHKSPVFCESDTGDDCAEYVKSPAFGEEARHDSSPDGKASSPDGPNSDFIFSSQESLSPSARPSSCTPVSPIFPSSPAPSTKLAYSKHSTLSKRSLVSSGMDRKHARDVQLADVDRHRFPRVADDSSETELTSDTTIHWSDEDADETLVSSPSPVYPDEKSFQQTDAQAAHLKQVTQAGPEMNVSSCSLNTRLPDPNQSTVHYYWGIPFCPRGLDADAYTKVIVAQMEVYEKSLKEAQRCLLRKVEWGNAILPQSEKSLLSDSSNAKVRRRRGLRRKGRKLSSQEEVDSLPLETEEEEDQEAENEEEEEEMEKETPCKQGDQTDIDDCVVCPETPMSEDVHTDLSTPNSLECPETATRGDDQAVDEEETMEVNGETQTTRPVGNDMARNPSTTNDEEERVLGRSLTPELEPVSLEAAVECPICQGRFPAGKIERHAAYCNGEGDTAAMDDWKLADECSQVSLKPRRKRKRWTAEEESDASSTEKIQEKCYICQKAVALRDYSQHTDLCIQRRAAKTSGKGNLLAALERVDNMHDGAGPSRCRLQQGDVIDLRDDNEEEEHLSMQGVSNSPIKSFTPISEATDCLVNFKRQQRLKKPSHKRR